MTTADDLLRRALEVAREWIGSSPHGDNCFLTDYGEYSQCFCGKDSLENYIDETLVKSINSEEVDRSEPVAWPINGDTAKRIAEKQCVSYEVVQLIAREILNLHPPTKTAPRERITGEEMAIAIRSNGQNDDSEYADGFDDGVRFAERHHGIGGGDE